jgi:AraC family transcriptional regulator
VEIQASTTILGCVTLYDLIVPAGHVPEHDHEFSHLCIVLNGAFTEQSQRRGELCTPGMIRYSPAGDVHRIVVHDGGMRCQLIEWTGARPPSRSPSRLFRNHRELMERAHCLGRELGDGAGGSPFIAELLALELFSQTAMRRSGKRRHLVPAWLRRVREAIQDSPASERTLESLSRVADHHPTHIVRAFRTHFGCSIGDYARRLQLERARQRLCGSDDSIAAIAADTGFADQSHLTRMMRQYSGTTPARLRVAREPGPRH